MSGAETLTRVDTCRSMRWLRRGSFDRNTPEGRGRERHRRVLLTAGVSVLAKLLSVSTALVSVPLTLHYLGNERFGMWMTISSLIAMLAFADFGIANGVLSGVAAAHGKDDRDEMKRIVSSGFFLLAMVAGGLLTVLAVIHPFVPWPAVFNVQGDVARSEAGAAVAVFVVCFAAAIPLTLVQRVQMGLQQGFVSGLWQCAGTLLGLGGVLLAISLRAGLPWLVLAMAGAPVFVALLNSAHFYWHRRPDLRPRWSSATRAAARQVAGTGLLFFVLQLTVAAAYTSDSVVIAQQLGASAVAEYAVPEKMFGVVALLLGMLLVPLWPAYGEAVARGDHEWVRRTLRHSVALAFCVSAVTTLSLVFVGPRLIEVWVGHAVSVSMPLLLALAAWKTIESVGGALAAFLNGLRVVRLQVLCAIPTAVLALGLKVWWVPELGVAGAVWASVAAYLMCTALPTCLCLPALMRQQPARPR